MKRLLTYVLILGGVMLAALSGCQKEEEIFDSSHFYAYSTPISPFTATVVSYLQKQDDSTHLSVAISKRYGFPVWNKAQYVKSGNKVLLFVPLAKNEEKSVGGVWYFTQEGNSISYRVLGNNPSQAGFDQYFWMIDYFNQVLFANSVYQYKSPKTNGYLKTEASDGLFITRCVDTFINDYFTGTHCWDVFNDGNGDGSLGATDLSGNGDNFTPPSGGSTNPSDPNPNSELIPDSQLELLSPHEKANTQLAWMDTHGGKDVVTAILKVAYATGLTESDKTKIYQAIDVAYKSLKAQYIMAVFRPVAETLKPVFELVLLENISEGLVKGIAAMVGALGSERLTFFLIDKGDGNMRSLTKYGDNLYLFNRQHAFDGKHYIPNSGGQYTTFWGTGLTADGIESSILRSLDGVSVPYLPNTRLGRINLSGYEIAYTYGRKVDGTIVVSDYYVI